MLNNEKIKISTFKQYEEAFNNVYLEFKTKKGLEFLDILVFIVAYFIPIAVLKIIIKGINDNIVIIIALISWFIFTFFYIICLFIKDDKMLEKKIKNYSYQDINENEKIKNIKCYEIVKRFNKKLELYCRERLLHEYEIEKDTFKNILSEAIKRLDNLKNEKNYGNFEAILKVLFKSGLITWVVKFCVTQIISNFTWIIKWFKIENPTWITILIFIVTFVILLISSFWNTKKKNIEIEIGRKNILLDILIEIFTDSTINETIWITEEAEKKITENKGYFFTKPKEKPVSITEDNGKFFVIKDESNPKNIKLKKIKIEKIKLNNE